MLLKFLCNHEAPGGNDEWQDGCIVKTCKSGVLESRLADECVQMIEKIVEEKLPEKLAEKGEFHTVVIWI